MSLRLLFVSITSLLLGSNLGCVESSPGPEQDVLPAMDSETTGSAQEGNRGPHLGELIALGDGTYHAELITDDLRVSVFILDSSQREVTPIDAQEILVELMFFGDPRTFRLLPVPDSRYPPGTFYEYLSTDDKLTGTIRRKQSRARMTVVIEGTAYTVAIPPSE